MPPLICILHDIYQKLEPQRRTNFREAVTHSFSPSFTSVPPYSGKRTVSPSFKVTGISLPSLSRAPGPTATTFPEFSWNCEA